MRLRLKKIFLIWCCCLGLPLSALAEHIFGGYFKMEQTSRSPNKYTITLLVYMDRENFTFTVTQLLGAGGFLKIYRKSDNKEMRELDFKLPTIDSLIYENESCAKSKKLRTWVLTYQLETVLPPSEFSDAGGYYIVTERCCRNIVLANVRDPGNTGMVFYLEFPSLLTNGISRLYSTPVFRPLNGDYICINKTFRYNFSATDPNRDELRYSLVNPFKGHSTLAVSYLTAPAPYTIVDWQNGYSANNAIQGSVPLRIDPKTGILTVRANRVGLYLFCVQVEKIRGGKVIGVVRHDFQLPVIDCNSNIPPVPVITHNGTPVTEIGLCVGQKIALATTANPAWTFQWQKDDTNIEGANDEKLVVSEIGTYTVVKSWANICASDTFATIKVKPANNLPVVKIAYPALNLCANDSLLLSVPAADTISYTWSLKGKTIKNGNQLVVKSAGVYEVQSKKTNTDCISSKDSVEIELWPQEQIKITQSELFCKGKVVVVSTKKDSLWRYVWSNNGNKIDSTASINISEEGQYRLTVIDQNKCKTVKDLSLAYSPNCIQLYIPTVFTPNGDGQNDRWHIYNLEADPKTELWVFNRWGEAIYHASAPKNDWDGSYQTSDGKTQKVQAGCYTYLLTSPASNHRYTGSVCVMY